MEQQKQIMNRFYLFVLGLFLFAFVLVGKLLYIQTQEGAYYRELAQQRTVKNVILQPSRGNIYSDDESLLATTVPRYEIRWDAKVPSNDLFQRNKKALAKGLSDLLGETQEHHLLNLERAKRKENRYTLIGRNLTYSEYKQIKTLPLFSLSSLRGGLIVESKLIREHPLGKIGERTIGYEKRDVAGDYLRVGLEGAFSQYLKGENGRRLKQKIANGQWKPINDNNEKEPTEGYDVYTTINVNFQDIAHHALLGQLEKYEAEHGTVVVMETKTGAVKAIANLGRTAKGKYFEKLNYAVGTTYEPGSTFKLMAMIAALEDKVAEPHDLIDTKKGILTFYGKYKVRDSKKGGYGLIPLSKAFEVSSNTGIVQMIHSNYKNQPRKFIDRLYNMGLNEKLGIAITGEGQPKIPYPSDQNWNGITLPWMAYGYGVELTPLQTLTFYNAVANNGEMVKPRFIDRINSLGNETIKHFEKEVLNPSICSQETIEKVQKMMFNVVDKKWGTGFAIKDNTFTMAGKTGTCQVDYATDDVQYISSFVGYFPADNPEYSCIVLIYKPNKRKGYYGATVAAPVFKEIAKKMYYSTPVEMIVGLDSLQQSNKKQPSIEELLLTKTIPNLKGMPAMEALSLLEQMGIKVTLKGSGKVIRQSIKSGEKVKPNSSILLELS
ncbi:transpeptidase family protein [Flavobacteriaceae bacterium]|nr:transpeptidase family protein [Flavobacteriaceae bacterium]